MADDLFNIKNEFYLGNFQGAINEAHASDLVLSSPADEKERDVIVSNSSIPCNEAWCLFKWLDSSTMVSAEQASFPFFVFALLQIFNIFSQDFQR
jgi:hypothetical protein